MVMKWNRETIKIAAKELGINPQDIVASHITNDPFYQVSKQTEKFAEWFRSVLDQAKEVAPHVLNHLRRLHYYYSSLPDAKRHNGVPYINDNASWTYLIRCSKVARYMGYVRYEDLQDQRNPEPRFHADYSEHQEFAMIKTYQDYAFSFQNQGQPDNLDWRLGYPHFNCAEDIAKAMAKIIANDDVGYNAQLLQPFHLEVWVEKSTVNDVLQPICERFGVNFVVGKGEESITRAKELVGRVVDLGKPTRVFYISDYDDQGVCMPEAVSRKVQFWNAYEHNNKLDVKLCHVALTKNQIERYDLPANPTKVFKKQPIDFKRSRIQQRYTETVRKRHPRSTELDALEALHPGELGRILTEALSQFVDVQLQERINDAVEDYRTKIYNTVYEAVMLNDEEITKLIEAFDAQYEEVNKTIRELRGIVGKIKETVEPINKQIIDYQNYFLDYELGKMDALELPQPKVKGDSDINWLYDSNLGYFDQTKRLKDHSNR